MQLLFAWYSAPKRHPITLPEPKNQNYFFWFQAILQYLIQIFHVYFIHLFVLYILYSFFDFSEFISCNSICAAVWDTLNRVIKHVLFMFFFQHSLSIFLRLKFKLIFFSHQIYVLTVVLSLPTRKCGLKYSRYALV